MVSASTMYFAAPSPGPPGLKKSVPTAAQCGGPRHAHQLRSELQTLAESCNAALAGRGCRSSDASVSNALMPAIEQQPGYSRRVTPLPD
jgi:hypothetical protein